MQLTKENGVNVNIDTQRAWIYNVYADCVVCREHWHTMCLDL